MLQFLGSKKRFGLKFKMFLVSVALEVPFDLNTVSIKTVFSYFHLSIFFKAFFRLVKMFPVFSYVILLSSNETSFCFLSELGRFYHHFGVFYLNINLK